MEKFNKEFHGYNKVEVNNFLDKIILEYENLLNKLKSSDNENKNLKDKIEHYEKIEKTLNRAIFTAESKCDQIKTLAREESELIVDDAKKNANRIISEALMKAERAENEAVRIRRNVAIFKRKIKSIIEAQLEVVGELDNINLKSNDREDIK